MVFQLPAVTVNLDDVLDIIDLVTYFSGTNPLAPTEQTKLDSDEDTIVHIKSVPRDAEIYINGVYKGKTEVTLKNLRPGKYRLELKKQYYECDVYNFTVKAGYEQTFEVNMKELQGTFWFRNIPSDASVLVDGNRVTSKNLAIIAGDHIINIIRFGFNPIVENYFLQPYADIYVEPDFVESPFELTDFQVSRDFLNPEIKGALGKVEVTFSVTNKGTARLSVFAPDGSLTNRYQFGEFNTWNQSYTWNGYSDDGKMLDDGLYWIELDCEGSKYETCVTINRTLNYPVMNFSTNGFSYSNVPSIEPFSIKYGTIAVSGSPVFSNEGYAATGIEVAAGGCFSEALSGGAVFKSYITDNSGFPFSISGNFRYNKSFAAENGRFCTGAFLRYGYAFDAEYMPVSDYGAGLGFGTLAGWNNRQWSLTGSAQYVLGSKTGNILEKENSVILGLSTVFKPVKIVSIYADGMFTIGKTAVVGGGINWLPFGAGVMINAGAQTVLGFDSMFGTTEIKAGLTFVF